MVRWGFPNNNYCTDECLLFSAIKLELGTINSYFRDISHNWKYTVDLSRCIAYISHTTIFSPFFAHRIAIAYRKKSVRWAIRCLVYPGNIHEMNSNLPLSREIFSVALWNYEDVENVTWGYIVETIKLFISSLFPLFFLWIYYHNSPCPNSHRLFTFRMKQLWTASRIKSTKKLFVNLKIYSKHDKLIRLKIVNLFILFLNSFLLSPLGIFSEI